MSQRTANNSALRRARRQNRTGHALLRAFIHEYQWVHIVLGLFGNTSFVVGSVFFLYASLKLPAIWLFIVGSAGMLIGSIGNAVVTYEERRYGSLKGREENGDHAAKSGK